MKEEEYHQLHYRAQFDCRLASNQKIKQFDFHDMIDFATQFADEQNKELIEDTSGIMDFRESVDNLLSRLPDSKIDWMYDDNDDTKQLQKAVKEVRQILSKTNKK